MALLRCPVCGGLLRNERHLHAEDPTTIHGKVVRPDYIDWDEATVEIREPNVYDYREREDGGADEG